MNTNNLSVVYITSPEREPESQNVGFPLEFSKAVAMARSPSGETATDSKADYEPIKAAPKK